MPTAPPQSVWPNYRLRYWLVWGLWFAYMPFMLGMSAVFPSIRGESLFGCYACVWAAAIIWHAEFRCPACGKHFHRTNWWHNPFSRRCLNCGLPKYQEPSPPNPATNPPAT
jgi:hypothetical protein